MLGDRNARRRTLRLEGEIPHPPRGEEPAAGLRQQIRDSGLCADPRAPSIGHQLRAAMVVRPIAGCPAQFLESRPLRVAEVGVGITLQQPGERPTLQLE